MDGLEKLIKIIAPVVTGLGYDLWGCELINAGRSQKLRIYIDKDKGIDVEDCATVSRQVSAVLDVEDPIAGEYILEVSSPGMDRPLFFIEQYQRLIGETIKLRVKVPQNGRRNFVGKIKAVENNKVILILDDQEVSIASENIGRANVVPTERITK